MRQPEGRTISVKRATHSLEISGKLVRASLQSLDVSTNNLPHVHSYKTTLLVRTFSSYITVLTRAEFSAIHLKKLIPSAKTCIDDSKVMISKVSLCTRTWKSCIMGCRINHCWSTIDRFEPSNNSSKKRQSRCTTMLGHTLQKQLKIRFIGTSMGSLTTRRDCAPADYHLFRSMQHGLADQHLKTYEEINHISRI